MTCEIARHLAQQGANVVVMPVITNGLSRRFPRKPAARDARGDEFHEELERDGVRVIPVPQSKLHFELDGLCVRRAIAALLREQRVDVVLGYFREAAFLPAFLRARGSRVRRLACCPQRRRRWARLRGRWHPSARSSASTSRSSASSSPAPSPSHPRSLACSASLGRYALPRRPHRAWRRAWRRDPVAGRRRPDRRTSAPDKGCGLQECAGDLQCGRETGLPPHRPSWWCRLLLRD